MHLEAFFERSNRAASTSEATSLLVEAFAEEGVEHVVYRRFLRRGEIVEPHADVHTYPETWTSHYYACGYNYIDPLHDAAKSARRPFLWEPVLANETTMSRKQRQLLADARTAGLAQGATIPLHGPLGSTALLSFSISEPERAREARLPRIAVIAIQFNMVYQSLVEPTCEPDPVALTDREREVLLWSAQGKSNPVIAEILGISVSAVNFHVTNAMRKLDASSRVMAIARAIRLGLIHP